MPDENDGRYKHGRGDLNHKLVCENSADGNERRHHQRSHRYTLGYFDDNEEHGDQQDRNERVENQSSPTCRGDTLAAAAPTSDRDDMADGRRGPCCSSPWAARNEQGDNDWQRPFEEVYHEGEHA